MRRPFVMGSLIFVGILLGINTLYCPLQPLSDRLIEQKTHEFFGRGNGSVSLEAFLAKGFKVGRRGPPGFLIGGRKIEVYYVDPSRGIPPTETVIYAELTMTPCGRISQAMKMAVSQFKFDGDGKLVTKSKEN